MGYRFFQRRYLLLDPLLKILYGKDPEGVITADDHFNDYSAAVTAEYRQSMPFYCAKDEVSKGAQKLGGCAGPCRVNSLILHGKILRQGQT